MTEPGDMDLIRRYASHREEEAFAKIVQRHLPMVYSAALRRVRDPVLAEEVSQTVFLILARKCGGLREGTIVTGWLYRTTQFAAATALRSERRRKLREQLPMDPEPSSDPKWDEIAPFLEDAVSSLGEKDRCALLLHFFEHKSLREVGLALGTSEDAAQKRVSRALDKVRRQLGKVTPVASLTALGLMLTQHAVHAAPVTLASAVTSASLAGVGTASSSVAFTSTLQLMAWTKTKTIILTAAVALLTISAGTVALLRVLPHNEPPGHFEGAWEGTLQVGEASMRLVTKVQKLPDGTFSATLDSVDQGAKDIPIPQSVFRGKSGRIELRALNAVFEGTLSADEQKWSGKWIQMGRTYGMVFARTDHPSEIASPIPTQALARRAGSDLHGYWKGVLSVGPIRLRLAFKILEGADGKLTATLDSLDQGVRNVSVTEVIYHKPVVEIEVGTVGGFYEGKLDAKGEQIVGKWSQSGKQFDLILERGDPDADPTVVGSTAPTKPDDLQGEWQGVMDVKGVKLRIELRIAKLPEGKFAATLDSPDQGAKGIPATTVSLTDPEARVEFKAISATFLATLSPDRLSGTWQQGPVKIPLALTRKKG